MSAQQQRGFSPIIIILVVILVLSAGFYFYKDQILSKFTKEKPSRTTEVTNKETEEWKVYNFKFGQISIKYPPEWVVRSPDNYPSEIKFIDFQPLKSGSEISDQYMVSVSAGVPYEYSYPPAPKMLSLPIPNIDSIDSSGSVDIKAPLGYGQEYISLPAPVINNNFNIPALGEGQNALFEQLQDQTSISFRKDGIEYRFTANIYAALQQKLDPVEITDVLTKMAKSVTFTDEVSSCSNFILKPLSDFPDNFVLGNSHQSDKKDQVSGYYFDINANTDKYQLDQTAASTAERLFIISYTKEGQPQPESTLIKNLVPVEGGGDIYGNNLSVLYLVNCAGDLLKQGTIKDTRIYKIGNSRTNPFNLELYADSKNPTRLWGTKDWSINLLKETRGTVYAKIGDKLQKYSATSFYATLK